MERRKFFLGLGAACLAPALARAQSKRLPIVGFLGLGLEEDAEAMVLAFRTGLAESGVVDGRDAAIDYRWMSRPDRLRASAADLVQRGVRVIVTAGGSAPAEAARAEARNLPVVAGDVPAAEAPRFFGNPPARLGNTVGALIVESNVRERRVAYLKEMAGVRRVGYLHEAAANTVEGVARAAEQAGVALVPVAVADRAGIEAAFVQFREGRVDGFIVEDPLPLGISRSAVMSVAARTRLPACYPRREYAILGGLMSLGVDYAAAFVHAGRCAGSILGGASPSDLPVAEIGKIDLVLNLGTARKLGLALPAALRAVANEILE